MSKKTKCIVVDDEPLAIELLEGHIRQFAQLELVATCWNAIEAFEIVKNTPVDIIFLDIQMPGLSGIQFVKSLQNPPAIIFTTAYREYAVESYELDVIDYLLKPITMDRFFKSITKYFDKVGDPIIQKETLSTTVTEDDHIYVNTNRKYVKVVFKEVLYVESIKDYVRIHLEKESISTKEKISVFEQKVPSYFMRTHRSYMVNTNKITSYTMQDIEIGEIEIPIGISYKKEVIKKLQS
ncbi:DNA-binding response regulator [Dokdonia pacifica]|uniref:Two component transcriptional regulator, LytTR family n=1 Tax=Dokdonia pacifica TaxID=1627892 RepID=A0A238VS16_9FLAO|nr:response regulator transcription factor [Dokdonia pacifica]GGG19139.1 DNA-binding response regulator [Dokdonia pacifica]SNR36299.1 two component transcriptional regulator, LytTR family [Dokdonia pacifica]